MLHRYLRTALVRSSKSVSSASIPPLALGALSGGFLAAAFPGTGDQGWLAFMALVPLLIAIEGAPWRRAGMLGFVAGLAFWFVTIPWVAGTMVRYGGVPWPLASLILLGLVGYLALYAAAFCALLSRCPFRSGAFYIVGTASLWVALEFLRTYLFTGFPWNLLGYSQYRALSLIQVAAVTGVYGVSFIVVAVNAALARVMLRDRQKITTSLGASLLVQWCSSTRHETGLESWLTSPVRHPRL